LASLVNNQIFGLIACCCKQHQPFQALHQRRAYNFEESDDSQHRLNLDFARSTGPCSFGIGRFSLSIKKGFKIYRYKDGVRNCSFAVPITVAVPVTISVTVHVTVAVAIPVAPSRR